MKAMSGWKVYQMNDCDWYVAETAYQATECMGETLTLSVEDLSSERWLDGEPTELSDAAMDSLLFYEEEPRTEITFREQLTKMIAAKEKMPSFFASTEG